MDTHCNKLLLQKRDYESIMCVSDDDPPRLKGAKVNRRRSSLIDPKGETKDRNVERATPVPEE